jgi:hypothetical protein
MLILAISLQNILDESIKVKEIKNLNPFKFENRVCFFAKLKLTIIKACIIFKLSVCRGVFSDGAQGADARSLFYL